MNVVIALAFAVAAQVAPATPAPSTPAPAPATYTQKPIVINYEEDVIEASPHGPNDSVITHKHDVKFKSLIHIRKSFEKELLSSADQLQ